MHYARKNSPGENGYRHFGPKRARTKSVLAFSTFTFKQGQNTKSDQVNHFQCILYSFTMNLNSMLYIQYILVMVYTHLYANKVFFSDYFGLDQHVSGCIWRSLTFTFEDGRRRIGLFPEVFVEL